MRILLLPMDTYIVCTSVESTELCMEDILILGNVARMKEYEEY
jgi:hypothetical protein